MKRIVMAGLLALVPLAALAQEKPEEKSSNLRQYYSGKFGFYQPSDGLNNGLLFGIDGITEFVHYRLTLSGAVDLYLKQNFGIFKNPPSRINQQAMVLIPLHASVGFEIMNIPDADTRAYLGGGGGYYLYFYAVDYQTSGGGIVGGLSSQSESKNGGNVFATAFLRILIGQIFLEPRLYLAASKEETLPGNHTYVVNPSGFAITMGFQYR
jgi:hypothetical protein